MGGTQYLNHLHYQPTKINLCFFPPTLNVHIVGGLLTKKIASFGRLSIIKIENPTFSFGKPRLAGSQLSSKVSGLITGLKQKILAGFSQIFPPEKLSSVHNFSSSNSPALTSWRAY
jgi:hypothetical protein